MGGPSASRASWGTNLSDFSLLGKTLLMFEIYGAKSHSQNCFLAPGQLFVIEKGGCPLGTLKNPCNAMQLHLDFFYFSCTKLTVSFVCMRKARPKLYREHLLLSITGSSCLFHSDMKYFYVFSLSCLQIHQSIETMTKIINSWSSTVFTAYLNTRAH